MESQEDGEGEDDTGGKNSGSRKRRREIQKEVSSLFSESHDCQSLQNATFAVSVSGVSVVQGPAREEVQRHCQDILNWEGSASLGVWSCYMVHGIIGLDFLGLSLCLWTGRISS